MDELSSHVFAMLNDHFIGDVNTWEVPHRMCADTPAKFLIGVYQWIYRNQRMLCTIHKEKLTLACKKDNGHRYMTTQ